MPLSSRILKGSLKNHTRLSGYTRLGFARVDWGREAKRGFPEVIYAQGKTEDQILKIAKVILTKNRFLLITKVTPELFNHLQKSLPLLKYHSSSHSAYQVNLGLRKRKEGTVLVITGGTSDISVAEEAVLTLQLTGNPVKRLWDVGVAGLDRLLDQKKPLQKASVIIVVAGMEGALASVVSGLTSKPVIAVPTSIGYGASFQGIAPLLSMLSSCSPGVVTVNIDNGFGAGYFANLINR